MPQKIEIQSTQILELFKSELNSDETKFSTFTEVQSELNGDWEAIPAILAEKGFSPTVIKKLQFTNDLVSLSPDKTELVEIFQKDKKTNSLRDIALNFDKAKLAKTFKTDLKLESADAADIAKEFHNALFHLEPTATILQIAENRHEKLFPSSVVDKNVASFLSKLPSFNIKTTSIFEAFDDDQAFEDIADEDREDIIGYLKSLQRIAAISPTPEAVKISLQEGFSSAFQISEFPEKQFIERFSESLGKETARQLHYNAVNSRIRNEQALIALKEANEGTGVAFIDQPLKQSEVSQQTFIDHFNSRRAKKFSLPAKLADDKNVKDPNWDLIFGDADVCECGECTSVYSAAAYFVDLLQYLRNNNLKPNSGEPTKIDIIDQGNPSRNIKGTPLESLFNRRPDLKHLELSCKNTNTILPYVDLANEVMESYVVNQKPYPFDFNTSEDDTSEQLLAQPQNTQEEAYCTLHHEVFPFTLPYHQPIDAIRIYLNSLGTSRLELIETFRLPRKGKKEILGEHVSEVCLDKSETSRDSDLDKCYEEYLSRAVDAESLNLTQDEYVILTKEAFCSKDYWDKQSGSSHSVADYQTRIGVKPVHKYFGYKSEADLESDSPADKLGLTFVKDQFLPRTGIDYVDLVELLKTRSLNPHRPVGKALSMMDSIVHIYAFLKSLVESKSEDLNTKYKRLIAFLRESAEFAHLFSDIRDIDAWIHSWFDKAGKTIVLYTDENPTENNSTTKKAVESCSIEGVRLIHLDGTPVTIKEYDNLQRFIRLWRKLGWTINEVDQAIIGLKHPEESEIDALLPDNDDCNDLFDNDDDCGCSETVSRDTVGFPEFDITPNLLHQLVAVKKLLERTGLELTKLLTFWSDIDTNGENSLYKQLFLKPDLIYVDNIVKADESGNYLVQKDKVSAHLPVIMAALRLSYEDIEALMGIGNFTLPQEIDTFKDITPTDELSLANLSLFYRFRLLARILGIKIPKLIKALPLFNKTKPFSNADTTLEFLDLWTKIEDAGFDFQKLNFIIRNKDDKYKPYTPSPKFILDLAKKLYDGLNSIGDDNVDISENEAIATIEHIKNKAALLFDTAMVDKLLGFLEGTTVYSAKFEENSLKPDHLKEIENNDSRYSKVKFIKTEVKFDPEKPIIYVSSVQITGILSENEEKDFLGLSSGSTKLLDAALKDIKSQQQQLFEEVFKGLIEAAKNLPAGQDISNLEVAIKQPDFSNDSQTKNTASEKRLAFLRIFIPYLRSELTKRFISETLGDLFEIGRERTDLLVSRIIKSDQGSGLYIYHDFENIRAKSDSTAQDRFPTYLIPPADGEYVFIIDDVHNPQVEITANKLEIKVASNNSVDDQDSSKRFRWSNPIRLSSAVAYEFSLDGIDLESLKWKTTTSPITSIPASALLPGSAASRIFSAIVKLQKAAMVVNGFGLNTNEISYFDSQDSATVGVNFSNLTFDHWQTLDVYTQFRNYLPKTKTNLIEFFNWARGIRKLAEKDQAKAIGELPAKIEELTNWKKETIEVLISDKYFNIDQPEDYFSVDNLIKIKNALAIRDKIDVAIPELFWWANPTSKFNECLKIADSVRNTIRSKFRQTEWEQFIKPSSDELRKNQKNALIAYLLQQDRIKNWNIVDADSLFEFFLIDVQMEPCVETSRIKQAISSVQLFILRCLLGLEKNKSDIKADDLDRARNEWMSHYRVWEANRKVFLYPENWIESNLRDDKSQFFKELESELLQTDINQQNVEDALREYLYKVDEVANMEVIGFYVDGKIVKDSKRPSKLTWSEGAKLHVFARTRNTPYFFYYRFLALDEMNWYPWERMQVDVPSYDYEDLRVTITNPKEPNVEMTNPYFKQIKGNGCYLSPIVWNNRLFIFFPQIAKKTKPVTKYRTEITDQGKKDHFEDNPTFYEFATAKSSHLNDSLNSEVWEIKMAWSEYRKGKWTQKKVSNDAVFFELNLNPIEGFKIVPILLLPNVKQENGITICVKGKDTSNDFAFFFDGNKIKNSSGSSNLFKYLKDSTFHRITIDEPKLFFGEKVLKTLDNFFNLDTDTPKGFQFNIGPEAWEQKAINEDCVDKEKFEELSSKGELIKPNLKFFHPNVNEFISTINSRSIDELFHFQKNFSKFGEKVKLERELAFGSVHSSTKFHELKKPYSIYNWELFFHTPMLIADALSKSQQFEQAMNWFHFVFDPKADSPDERRVWKFTPFKFTDAKQVLENIFNSLKPNTPDNDIDEWRTNPFQPHLIARSRPVAYMKWVVMKYVDNLISWGDHLYRQDTIEAINQATQLYVLAGHIMGQKPQFIPKRGKSQPQTYDSLLDKLDAFSNALVELELVGPYSNKTIPQSESERNSETNIPSIYGFATSLYFCLPKNPKLLGYWDTVSDRLFKIRHGQNIEGIFRKLPLFEPPIDPALLINAAAQGLSISSVLNDLNTPMPNYRFVYLLQKAIELCNELKSLGNAMLSAIEKKDNEAISLIRARHEGVMNNAFMEIKKQQLEEATKALESLYQNRKAPEHRMNYYLQLIGEDAAKIPGIESDFSEIVNAIDPPVSDSGLKLSKYEVEDFAKSREAQAFSRSSGDLETQASILHVLPAIDGKAEFWGIGISSIIFSGQLLGNAAQAIARSLQVKAGDASYSANNASKKGGFQRVLQDRIMQANAAGYELKQIDKQIVSQQIRIAIANQEIINQQKQIDNSEEIHDFLKNKYTNVELYAWMRSNLKTVYRQVYGLAFDLAKKAEKTYRFERGITSSNFINAGYWNDGYDGLLAGEQLYVGLKQLEAAYHESLGYDFETKKQISLRQINPLALLQLRETGTCEFTLPEVLFDMDYAGHYKRRIKSVSLSIPCITGPYTNVNATLRLIENKFRNTPIVKNDYPEKTGETDDRFSSFLIPITAISASTAQNDSGRFELNFKDERYIPFEGAGVISKWRLELPDFRHFDYDTISDVIMHMGYVATEGGNSLKKAANDTSIAFMKSVEELRQQEGLFAIIDLQHDLPTEWHQAMHSKIDDVTRLTIKDVLAFLPYFSKIDRHGKLLGEGKVKATDVVLVTDPDSQISKITLNDSKEEFVALSGQKIGMTTTFGIHNEISSMQNWKLEIKNTTNIKKALMVIRFTINKD